MQVQYGLAEKNNHVVPFSRSVTTELFGAITTNIGDVSGQAPYGYNFSPASIEGINEAEKGEEARRVHQRHMQLEQVCGTSLLPIATAHGAEVITLQNPSAYTSELIESDAVVIESGGVFMRFADCMPGVIIGEGRAALFHAGWRNLIAGIIPSSVKEMAAAPETLLVYLGACAHQLEFDVDSPGLDESFLRMHRSDIVQLDHGRVQIGLSSIAVKQLVEAGVPPENIVTSSVDTLREPKYYSYRQRYAKAALTGQAHPGGRFAVALFRRSQ